MQGQGRPCESSVRPATRDPIYNKDSIDSLTPIRTPSAVSRQLSQQQQTSSPTFNAASPSTQSGTPTCQTIIPEASIVHRLSLTTSLEEPTFRGLVSKTPSSRSCAQTRQPVTLGHRRGLSLSFEPSSTIRRKFALYHLQDSAEYTRGSTSYSTPIPHPPESDATIGPNNNINNKNRKEKEETGQENVAQGMAGYPRESAFIPTIKCSICGNDIEISKMGDHICSSAPAAEPAAPPPPPPDLLGGAFASLKQTVWGFGSRAAPPTTVDTSAANKAFTKPDQLTPVSSSTESRTISPKTPTAHLGAGPNGEDYFSPTIADSPSQTGRTGGYGGFADPQPYDGESMYGYGRSPKKQAQAPNVLQRMNTIAPGPFEISRRAKSKNAFAPRNEITSASESNYDDMSSNSYGSEQPAAATSYPSGNNGSIVPPRMPRKNGYGGFGPPQRDQYDSFEPPPFGSTQRSETFPTPSQNEYHDLPARTPSAPGPRLDRSRRPTGESQERPVMTRDREQRPSFGMQDNYRPPPPRKNPLRSPTIAQDLSSSINLADEFGVGNPYHTPSDSQSSSNSGYSQTTQPSQTSSNSSPARSAGSRRKASDTSNIDALMNDLQSSMDSLNPKDVTSAPSLPPPTARNPPPIEQRERSDNLRFDPAVQGGPPPRVRSPLASSANPEPIRSRVDPAIQGGRSRSPPPRTHNRQQSMGRSRGNCKACQLPITGKSIASADGQLTGRYHKACFVCTTCQNPFTSSTFYVLNDKPYDAVCYHRLNGSCCGTCDNGIEGQYLEDESSRKHHPDCFRCGDCSKVLRDGYFEVNGKAYCERDAWKRVQQPALSMPSGRNGGPKPPPSGRPYGLPSGNRLGPSGLRPRMEKRMTRIGMM